MSWMYAQRINSRRMKKVLDDGVIHTCHSVPEAKKVHHCCNNFVTKSTKMFALLDKTNVQHHARAGCSAFRNKNVLQSFQLSEWVPDRTPLFRQVGTLSIRG